MKFSVKNGCFELAIKLMKAGLEIVETDGEDVVLEYSELRKKTADDIFNINFENNILHINESLVRKLPVYASLFNNRLNTDIKLKIPKNISTSGFIKTVSGAIRIDTLNFSGSIKTLSGNMDIDRIDTGDLDINSVSGTIRIKELNGSVCINTIGGNARIEKGNLRGVSLKTVSGDVRLSNTFTLENDGEISTVTGGIKLNILRYQSDKSLYISTLNGSTKLDGNYPKDKIHLKQRISVLKQFPFKDFAPMLKDIISGFSSMKERPDVEVHPRSGLKEEDTNIEMVLRMLSEGKITLEEAERLIKTIRG